MADLPDVEFRKKNGLGSSNKYLIDLSLDSSLPCLVFHVITITNKSHKHIIAHIYLPFL